MRGGATTLDNWVHRIPLSLRVQERFSVLMQPLRTSLVESSSLELSIKLEDFLRNINYINNRWGMIIIFYVAIQRGILVI